MQRRSFLFAAGAAIIRQPSKSTAQTYLGTLIWTQTDGIWVRGLPDGRAAKLASGARLHNPRFSASGRWIACREREDRVLVVDVRGSAGASLEGEACRWLPREDRLAIQKGRDVAVFGPENQWKAELVLRKDAGLGPFNPDGTQYAAERIHERAPDQYGLNRNQAELYVASQTAPEHRRVLIAEHEGDIRPYAWTRDGRSVIYWKLDEWSGSAWSDGVGLYEMPVAGGPERDLGIAALAHEDMLGLAPASAGNLLAVTRAGERETWADKQIVLVDLNTGATRDLTPPDISAQCPAWSPDGRQIAYFAAPDAEIVNAKAEAGKTLRIIRPDGTVKTEVMTPATRIGIGGGEEAHGFAQQRKIWLVDVPSGVSRQRTHDTQYRDEEPLWSADGSHILFGRMDYEGNASLWLMESNGSNAREVCRLVIHRESPADETWFGYYGYIHWRSAFDWRR